MPCAAGNVAPHTFSIGQTKNGQPFVIEQVAHRGVLGHDGVDGRLGGLDEHAQALGGVAKVLAIVQRLQRQPNAQVTAIAFKHPTLPPTTLCSTLSPLP